MFCRKCGKTLLDGDRFCSYCGAQVIERNKSISGDENVEEVIYNNAPKTGEALGVDVPKKSIAQAWQDINEGRADKPSTWNLKGYPNTGEEIKKTEDIVVDWTTPRVKPQDNSKVGTHIKVEPVTKTEPELTLEIQSHTRKDLLERDHTRIFEKSKVEEGLGKKEELKAEPMAEESPTISFDLETELFGRKSNLQPNQNQPDTDSIDKFYTFSKKNEEFQKLLDKEYNRLKKDNIPVRKEPSNLEIQTNGEDHITGIEKILQQKIIQEAPQINAEPAMEITKAENTNQFCPKAVLSDMPKTENLVLETTPNLERIVEKPAPTKILESDIVTPIEPSDSKGDSEDGEIKRAAGLEEVVLPWDENSTKMQAFVDEDANKKKISLVKVILSIVILLLVFEISILGIKYFFPESGAAKLINEKLGIAVNWVEVLQPSSDSKPTKEESNKKTEQDTKAVSAETKSEKERNLTDVLEPLRVYNNNIKAISINQKLAFDETKDYGKKDINNSVPIENSIWYQDKEGNNVYLDSEIFKTVICFNSLWIDYLNAKNTDVLAQTKEGSTAYNNAKNYSKLGKISEVFNSLELGEMRQGEEFYYIWVKEDVQKTEKGTVKNQVTNYIYYLEPVGQELKIVDYKEY